MSETARVEADFRITVSFLKLFSIFIVHLSDEFTGEDICRRTEMQSGTVYPMLIKLEERGWLKARWENINPHVEGRPKRHYYGITKRGLKCGIKILADHFPSRFAVREDT